MKLCFASTRLALRSRCMVVGPSDLRSTLASRDEAAFVLQRRLVERISDDVLAGGLLTPLDSNKFALRCVSGRRVWWRWIRHNAAIALRCIAQPLPGA